MDFFERWFKGFSEGLDCLSQEECSRLFGKCASMCAKDALRDLYADLFAACGGNLDEFFSRLHEVKSVDGRVVEQGRIYEIIFLECGCDLHTRANVTSTKLCECSRQSILCELKTLMPEQEFTVEEIKTILNGDDCCCFRITRK